MNLRRLTTHIEKGLLRGVPLDTLLGWMGALFSPPPKNWTQGVVELEELHNLSQEVPNNQIFVSHSWRDSRWSKYVSILWLKNGRLALGISFTFLLLTMLWIRLGILPLTKALQVPASALSAYIVYVLVLMFGHKFSGVFVPEHESNHVFLDKCCIDQVDEARKTAGIRALGAFLEKSERMAVLFSRDYFDRLWCSYEMAIFLSFNKPEQVDFLDLEIMRVLFIAQFLNFTLILMMTGMEI